MKGFMRKFIIFSLLTAVLAGREALAEWGGNGSFSPISMNKDNGKPLKLQWTYIINNGQPIVLTGPLLQGLDSVRLKFGNLLLTIDPKTLQRTAKITGHLVARLGARTAGGRFSMKIVENLLSGDEGKILISDETADFKVSIAAGGVTARIVADLVAQISPPYEWFLDRNDLDTLGIGYVYSASAPVTLNFQGSVCAKMFGRSECRDLDDSSIASPERWEVKQYYDHYQVGNRLYANVVEVTQDTVLPVFDGSTVNSQETTVTYFVAKGVGMIQGQGQYQFSNEALPIQLRSTSIVIPKINRYSLQQTSAGDQLKIKGVGFGKVRGKVMLDGEELTVDVWKNNVISIDLAGSLASGQHWLTVQKDNGNSSAIQQIDIP